MRTAMRAAMLLTALGAVAVPVLGAPPKGYTNRFDSIDIEKVLSNSRITNRYIDCLLDRVQCTAEGRELKKLLPDALKTSCAKCSDKQRSAANKAVRFLQKNKPKEWEQLVAKYDPTGEAQTKFASILPSPIKSS